MKARCLLCKLGFCALITLASFFSSSLSLAVSSHLFKKGSHLTAIRSMYKSQGGALKAPPFATRIFSSHHNGEDETNHTSSGDISRTELSEKDLQRIDRVIGKRLLASQDVILGNGNWDISYARQRVIRDLREKDNICQEEASDKFKELDDFVDLKRDRMNFPYKAGLGMVSLGIPATWALVYNKHFYNKVLEHYPWLETTSWDWSEPIVQSLLTTQTGCALIVGCLTALGYRPYVRWRDKKLAADIVSNYGVSEHVAKAFVKADRRVNP